MVNTVQTSTEYQRSDTVDVEDSEHLFCTCPFCQDQHGEQRVQCLKCYRWAHEYCGAQDYSLCAQHMQQLTRKRVSYCFVKYVEKRRAFKFILIVTWVSYEDPFYQMHDFEFFDLLINSFFVVFINDHYL
jgi:hypothetical protein